MKKMKYGIGALVIILLLGTGITTVWLNTKGATSQKDTVSTSEEVNENQNETETSENHIDSSDISYESNVEIVDEETFEDEIEMNAQNGEEATDINAE